MKEERRQQHSNKNKNKTRHNNFNSLHGRDIMYGILTRVPAESLVRFKLVCKYWKTIISDPKFIRSHLQTWESKPAIIVTDFIARDLLPPTCLVSDFQEKEDYSKDFPIHFPKGFSNIVTSTDGLLLLRGFTIWSSIKVIITLCVHNPVTGRHKKLPPPNSNLTTDCPSSIVYDASIQKYKVVVFIYGIRNILEKINIITVHNDGDGDGDWREILMNRRMQAVFNPITVNGILYWIAYTCDVETVYISDQVAFIQSMDIAKEEFMQRIRLPCQPNIYSHKQLINCNLLEMKGSLYFSNPATDMKLVLWMLEDFANHVWVKKHKICLLSIVGKPDSLSSFLVRDSFYPVQLMGNRRLMIVRHEPATGMGFLHVRGWYLYNLSNQELKAIKEKKYQGNHHHFHKQITHIKSLVDWN